MDELQQQIWDAMLELSGEQVLQILTDIHGLQILDGDVKEELVNLGHLEDEDDFDNNDDEENDYED